MPKYTAEIVQIPSGGVSAWLCFLHNRLTKSKRSKIMPLVILEGQQPGQAVERHAARAGLYCLLGGGHGDGWRWNKGCLGSPLQPAPQPQHQWRYPHSYKWPTSMCECRSSATQSSKGIYWDKWRWTRILTHNDMNHLIVYIHPWIALGLFCPLLFWTLLGHGSRLTNAAVTTAEKCCGQGCAAWGSGRYQMCGCEQRFLGW